MSNIKPKTPSFVFGYWRPWKENSNAIDSYLDYAKDVSLAKYGADIVGKYINQASKEQVNAINQLGQSIGRGINVLSNQMSDINDTLGFLNRNMDIQIEQQKLSNLLLQNIAELLRVPDSEKERQHSIELGIKFFVNAKKDSDLYSDALEELLKAESLMKQDYFVLHRIGCIYLYVEKYINPEKAIDYFHRAAKYASVESDPSAVRLINALNGYHETLNESKSGFNIILSDVGIAKFGVVKVIKDNAGFSLREASALVDNAPQLIKINFVFEDAESFKKLLEEAGAQASITKSDKLDLNIANIDPLTAIEHLASDSYEKAAFSSYILGRFEEAVNYQSKSLKFNSTPENRFLLAKYQARNGNKKEAIENLDICINEKPIYAIAVFKEIDLVNEPEVLNLIEKKNEDIDKKISQLSEKLNIVENNKANDLKKKLTELLKKSYEIKIADFNKYENEANTINTNLSALDEKIDVLIRDIKSSKYLTFDINGIFKIIKELENAKDLIFEKKLLVFDKLKKETEDDKLKIGSKYEGGIIFYLDKTGNYGLVFADTYLGEAPWGWPGEIGANSDGIANGAGMENTKKIVEKISSKTIYENQRGWFFTKVVEREIKINTAARLCLELTYNGFNDWYLPTKSELALIHSNLDLETVGDIKRSSSDDYWSSNQDASDFISDADICDAFCFDFHSGRGRPSSRDNKKSVLAVRAF